MILDQAQPPPGQETRCGTVAWNNPVDLQRFTKAPDKGDAVGAKAVLERQLMKRTAAEGECKRARPFRPDYVDTIEARRGAPQRPVREAPFRRENKDG